MVGGRAERILEALRKNFIMPRLAAQGSDSFRTLIVTMISQNTSDRNTAKAFENLSNKLRITPEGLANVETGEIEGCLKVAGLYRNKAKAIKQTSRVMLEKYDGKLDSILSLPLEEARKTLMEFPGVGPKTADVVLLFCAEGLTIPVDTHVGRVSKRLGLAPADGDYEAVRKALQSLYDPADYLAVHLLLILHGRKYCKARAPMCNQCPVSGLCPSRCLWEKN
jgi:endonuclease-3